MSNRNQRTPGIGIALIALLAAITFLWSGLEVYAAPGVEFEFAATDEAIELTNEYQDIVALTLSAPKRGYVVLTGSGTLTLTTLASTKDPVWAQAGISIGTIPSASNDENETGVEIPFAQGGGYSYRYPFSITTVIPVERGNRNFYMVGIRDPNTAFSTWSATCLKLTAIFIEKRM